MKSNWVIVYFDGFSTNRVLMVDCTYTYASKVAGQYPPGYIWHIEESEK